MSINLSDLKTRLQADAPAVGGVPTTAQYEQCVTDAVADYSRRRPIRRLTTIDVQAGTASYALPGDFLHLIKLETLGTAADVLNTPAGLVPLDSTYSEEAFVEGANLVFSPTPEYDWTGRALWYAARHVLTGEAYPLMTDADVDILMLYAQSLVLGLQANKMAGEAASYRVQGVSEKRGDRVKELRERAEELRKQYKAKFSEGASSTGIRASYTATEISLGLADY